MGKYIPAVHFVKRHLLPVLDGVTRQSYRSSDVIERKLRNILQQNGYIYTTSGCCCVVYAKPGQSHLIKVFQSNGYDIPLTCNPTRQDWRKMQRAGVTGSYEVFGNLPVELDEKERMRNQGFIPALVEHFLFYDYLHPEGLMAVQKIIDAGWEARQIAAEKFGTKYNHTGNYGLDDNRPVIIDWY